MAFPSRHRGPARAKPRGLGRLTRKLAKALFFGLHGRLGLPARGEMEVPTPADPRSAVARLSAVRVTGPKAPSTVNAVAASRLKLMPR